MKAYLYDPDTGLYEGESFAEADTLEHERGLTSVPPPDYGLGQVPVFDHHKKSWEVIPISVVRQLLGPPRRSPGERS